MSKLSKKEFAHRSRRSLNDPANGANVFCFLSSLPSDLPAFRLTIMPDCQRKVLWHFYAVVRYKHYMYSQLYLWYEHNIFKLLRGRHLAGFSTPISHCSSKCCLDAVNSFMFLSWYCIKSKRKLTDQSPYFKRLWSPGIDSKEWIPPAYVPWRAGTITLFLLGS
jgi:hypothetical protein